MTPVSKLMTKDQRGRERFRIECPVVGQSPSIDLQMATIRGILIDMASNGARLVVTESLPTGSHVVLEARLPSPRRGSNRIRFEGTVLRLQLHYEVAVAFPDSGRFLRPFIHLNA
jgi:hypothetical protein